MKISAILIFIPLVLANNAMAWTYTCPTQDKFQEIDRKDSQMTRWTPEPNEPSAGHHVTDSITEWSYHAQGTAGPQGMNASSLDFKTWATKASPLFTPTRITASATTTMLQVSCEYAISNVSLYPKSIAQFRFFVPLRDMVSSNSFQIHGTTIDIQLKKEAAGPAEQ